MKKTGFRRLWVPALLFAGFYSLYLGAGFAFLKTPAFKEYDLLFPVFALLAVHADSKKLPTRAALVSLIMFMAFNNLVVMGAILNVYRGR